MNEPAGVGGSKRARHAKEPADLRLYRGGAGGDAATKGTPFEQLHHDVRGAIYLADVEYRDDVWMVERRDRARLAQQTSIRLTVDPPRLQDLERHRPAQAKIIRRVDSAHAALSENASIR